MGSVFAFFLGFSVVCVLQSMQMTLSQPTTMYLCVDTFITTILRIFIINYHIISNHYRFLTSDADDSAVSDSESLLSASDSTLT